MQWCFAPHSPSQHFTAAHQGCGTAHQAQNPRRTSKKYVHPSAALWDRVGYRDDGKRRDVAHNQRTASPGSRQRACRRRRPTGISVPCPKRRPSKIITTRSQLSTFDPDLTLHSPVAASSMSDSEDKKRNKLGYQRISIACGMSPLAISHLASRPSCHVDTRQWLACSRDSNSSSSSLSPEEDTLPACRRRPPGKMPELHSTQEGVRLLSS